MATVNPGAREQGANDGTPKASVHFALRWLVPIRHGKKRFPRAVSFFSRLGLDRVLMVYACL